MIQKILENWRIAVIISVLIIACETFIFLWGYSKGYASCEQEYTEASIKAVRDNADANTAALGKELIKAAERSKTRAEINNVITESKDAKDIAPDTDQLFYDRLRKSQIRTGKN